MAKFATGEIQHDLIAGGEYDLETSDPKYFTNTRADQHPAQPQRKPDFRSDRSPISG